jgi:hypothetical protein
MVKSDSHMERIRQRLLDERAGMKKSEEKRKEREGKKFGKQVQIEKLKERERGKKEMQERLKNLKRSKLAFPTHVVVGCKPHDFFFTRTQSTKTCSINHRRMATGSISQSKKLSLTALRNEAKGQEVKKSLAMREIRSLGLAEVGEDRSRTRGSRRTTLARNTGNGEKVAGRKVAGRAEV